MSCDTLFSLTEYVDPADTGSGTLFTSKIGAPTTSTNPDGSTRTQRTVIAGAGSPTLLAEFLTEALVAPTWFLGTGLFRLLVNAIDPTNNWAEQAYTVTVEHVRAGATIAGPFAFSTYQIDGLGIGSYGAVTSLAPIDVHGEIGDRFRMKVYAVTALEPGRSDDGNHPRCTYGGGPASSYGYLSIPTVPDPLSQALPVYPTLACQAWPVLKRFAWATDVQASAGDRETRVSSWTAPLMEWELHYDVARSGTIDGAAYTEFEQLLGFYTARRGQNGRFLFDDVTDNQVVDEPLGTGDGVETDFVLSRTLGAHTAPIGRVNTIGAVKINGVATAAYTIAGNVLTLATAPTAGQVLTWSGSYYWVARFADPETDFGNFANRFWDLKKIRLRQLRV
jgi:uncharacterized protein (TIGR02217 family)